MQKKITIVTLAKELGVSAATVSRALNNSPELNADTIAMIRKKADEYGFRTRQMASRVINICVLLQSNDPNHDYFSAFTVDVMRGMMEYLHSNGLEFSLFNDTSTALNNGLLLRKLSQRSINGVVLLNTNKNSLFYNELNKNNFPYYSLFTGPEKITKNLLSVDNIDVAFQANNYLIQLGHRKIGLIVTAPTSRPGRDRQEGYKKALQNAGLTLDPALVCKTKLYGYEAGHQETLTLFQAHPELTALFVTGEQVAVGAMHAFHELGLSVPKHVSLITCDDAPEVEYLNPPLTVMNIPNRKFGYAAAQRVHQLIDGKKPDSPVHEPWMRSELIIRDSTAPPPNQ